MEIPKTGPDGAHMLSATQLRAYGAGGFRLTQHEEGRGCPRLYRARYVERRVKETRPFPLRYGGMLHDALYLMEEEAISPEAALDRVFLPDFGPETYTEALRDLRKYLERGASPTDRFGTIAVETELQALLYVDEEFGPVWYRGILDWLGIDLNDPTMLHAVDYKTNRQPPKQDDVVGDVQLRSYAWLVLQNWSRWMSTRVKKLVVHLDVIKFREVEVRYTEEQLEEWHAWAVAVARRILRDEEAKPKTNPGCAWCPVKEDCPAFEALPLEAKDLMAGKPAGNDQQELLEWRDSANAMRLLLEKAVDEIDARWRKIASSTPDGLRIGNQRWVDKPDWRNQVDLKGLHAAMGDPFYDVVTTSKTKVEKFVADWPASDADRVMQNFDRVVVGTKVARETVKEDR